MGFTNRMLDKGCALHIEAAHSESILILSGADKDKTFFGIVENDTDIQIDSDLSKDRRAKRNLSFRDSNAVPNLASQDTLQTEDGKKWAVVDDPQDGYLSTDFKLREIVDGIDT